MSLIISSVFALPGFTPSVKDIPGDYVFYKDSTFQRESYVGFLTYDEKTYAARYFAPATKKLPEKDIKIYFTVNPKADHMELTGEKVENGFAMSKDDTEIVNYLHDLIYELNSRRIKVSEVPSICMEDYPQFGGDVLINYDAIVPLFNVRSIINSKTNQKLLNISTCGRIQTATDNSFESFKGLPASYKDNRHKMPNVKKAVPSTIELEDSQSVTLDSCWKRGMENLWFLGDAALLTIGTLPATDSVDFLTRQLCLSTGKTYIDWNNINASVDFSKKSYIQALVYDSSNGNVTINIKIVLPAKENKSPALVMSVYQNLYKKNTKYFEKILESYTEK